MLVGARGREPIQTCWRGWKMDLHRDAGDCLSWATRGALGGEAGQCDQSESMPGPDPKRLVAEFHQDLKGGKFDSKMLKLVGGDGGKFVKTEEDGLHIRMPAGLDKPLPVGVAPRFRIHGDFEITASYAIVKADKPIRGYGLAVALVA